jgi:hypothetical protein
LAAYQALLLLLLLLRLQMLLTELLPLLWR